MEFDKSRVYTSLDANELKVGSKVIFADSLSVLKHNVERNECIDILDDIEDESMICRFCDKENHWVLCYLVSEPEEKKLKWSDLKLFDKVHNKVTDEIAIVVGIKPEAQSICIAEHYTNDLEDWEKVEDKEEEE